MDPAQMLEVASDLCQALVYFENLNYLVLSNFTTQLILNGSKTKTKTKVIA